MNQVSQGEIANLYRAECDIVVKDGVEMARLEDRIEQLYGQDVIPQIERIGVLAKSPVITTSFVKVIEKEFQRQDALVPTMSTFIEHIEDLIHVQFREVTENTPKDASVEI